MLQLRVITALLVTKYDINFAPGEDGTRLFQDCKDVFTAAPGQLILEFKPRAQGAI